MTRSSPSARRASRGRAAILACALLVGALAPATAAPGDARVPEAIDLPAPVGKHEVEAAGFAVVFADAPPGGGPVGTVARQEPGGYGFAAPGSRVTLFVRGGAPGSGTPPTSAGGDPSGGLPPSVAPTSLPPSAGATLPSVTGKTENEAIELLAGWRITILTVDSAPENAGRVTHQEPAAGSTLSADGIVEISVGRASTGMPPEGAAVVPSVLDMTQDVAEQRLTAAGLVPLAQPTATTDPAKIDRVIGQEPAAGAVVARNSNVVLSIGRMTASPLHEAEVPDCVRRSEAAARTALADAGFLVQVRDRLASATDNGIVLEQDPGAMSRLLRGRTVTLTVGRILMLPVSVPDVLNVESAQAAQTVRDAGFQVETVFADTTPASVGRVIQQEPPGGASKVRDSFVRLTIGRTGAGATASVVVPSVVGADLARAEADLATRGLVVRRSLVTSGPADDGRVISQSPAAGSAIARGDAVTIVVGRAASAEALGVPVPSYAGMDAATAQADAQAKGLRVALAYATGSPEGRVLGQQPAAGTVTVRGALVTLTVARAPALGVPTLLEPDDRLALPKNHGLVFRWTPVSGADGYEVEVMQFKDGAWQRESLDALRDLQMKVGKTKKGFYMWHVRARRLAGAVEGAWSAWRYVTIY